MRRVPVPGGCWWPAPDYQCCDVTKHLDADGQPDARLGLIETAAAEWLYNRTGRQYPGNDCATMLRPVNNCCCDQACPTCVGWGPNRPIHAAPPGIEIDADSIVLWKCGRSIPQTDSTTTGCPRFDVQYTPAGVFITRNDGYQWPKGQMVGPDPTADCCCPTGDDCWGASWGVEVCWAKPLPPHGVLALETVVCHWLTKCAEADCGCDGPMRLPENMTANVGGVQISAQKLAELEHVKEFLAANPPPPPPARAVFPEDYNDHPIEPLQTVTTWRH